MEFWRTIPGWMLLRRVSWGSGASWDGEILSPLSSGGVSVKFSLDMMEHMIHKIDLLYTGWKKKKQKKKNT